MTVFVGGINVNLFHNNFSSWKNRPPLENWQKTSSTASTIVLKNKLFRASIFHGLQNPEELHYHYQHRIRIARHHFPLRIRKNLSNIKSLSCIINTEVVTRIDEDITHNRLSDY